MILPGPIQVRVVSLLVRSGAVAGLSGMNQALDDPAHRTCTGTMTSLFLIALCATTQLMAGTRPQADDPVLDRQWETYLSTDSRSPPAVDFPYASCFSAAAAEHDLPETLLLAVARGESDFEPAARSSANAYGLMQILWPGTARQLGIERLSQLLDPCTNVEAGARYLRGLLDRYRGNLHRALAAYNYGPSRIPVTGGQLPEGAIWYSGYIKRHLDYVLHGNGKRRAGSKPSAYRSGDRLFIIHFTRPYRAAAFVHSLQPELQDIRLDWFRRPEGGYDVFMLYTSEAELEQGRQLLTATGFTPDRKQ
jgi:hypothetical protein